MNPLPRFLALGLFIVLALLSVLLAGSALRRPSAAPAPSVSTVETPHDAVRVARLSQRLVFPLALVGTALAVALSVSLALHAPRVEPPADISAQRAEMGALARLAESTVAQGEQLVRERDERERAQADALLHQERLNRSLEEQIQLGRDLHDGIIQSLYAAGLQIESARAVAATDAAEADRRLAECRQQLNRTIRDVRAYIAGLAPENLRQTSFADAVEAMVAELGAGRAAKFDLRIDDAASAQLTLAQSTETLQIAREAVSNALRHGGARQLTIRLHPGDGAVCLLVQDDGCGFDPQRASTGHGMGNIRARAARIGADVRIDSTPGSGTRVVFTLPVART